MREQVWKLHELLEPSVNALGYELVGVEYHPQGRNSVLRLYIDSAAGITLDDCERVSHQVSGVLDVEEPIRGQYRLEVSSPGMDRPLFKSGDFNRFAGRVVRIRLLVPVAGRRKLTGVLRGVRDNQVVVDEDGVEFVLPWHVIDRANLVPDIGQA